MARAPFKIGTRNTDVNKTGRSKYIKRGPLLCSVRVPSDKHRSGQKEEKDAIKILPLSA